MPAPPIEVQAGAAAPPGLAPGDFLARYWQKHPLLVRGAFAGLQAPLSADELAGLACEPYAIARLVHHDRATDAWHLTTGPFAEEVFAQLPPEDWTLLVHDVDKWDADVARVLDAFAFLPAWRIDDVMVSFAAPGGSVGPHLDHYDVFLLQGTGRRRWLISTDPQAPHALRPDSGLRLLREFHATHDWVLEPGDMLYLPPGVPHHGIAVDAGLTFSIGMRAPAVAELVPDLAGFVAERMDESRRYEDPDLSLPADPHEIDAAALERVRNAHGMLASVDAATLAEWFGRFMTRYRSAGEIVPPPEPPTPAEVDRDLDQGARLVRHPLARVAWTRTDEGALLFVAGEAYPTSPASARAVCSMGCIDAACWAALDAATHNLLHHLAREGVFAFE